MSRIEYTCSPDSLADIPAAEWEDEFRRLVATAYPAAELTVIHRPALSSGLTDCDLGAESWDDLRSDLRHLSERALEACCTRPV